jgi:hypothetical protein
MKYNQNLLNPNTLLKGAGDKHLSNSGSYTPFSPLHKYLENQNKFVT